MPALYMVLGQLVIAWGNIEASLNMAISVTYHDADGKSIEPDMPQTQLKRRLDFMRDCAKKLPILAPQRGFIIGLMDKISRHSGIRNSVLHGFFSNYDTGTGALTFTSLKGKDDHHEVREISGTLPELQRAATQALILSEDVTAFMHALSEAFRGMEDEIHQPGSKGTV